MSDRAWVERVIVPGTVAPGSKRRLELYAYLPGDEFRARAWLRRVLGSKVKLTQAQHRGVTAWKLSPAHLIPLAGAMADAYGVVKMRLEILREVDRCDTKCRDARATSVWKCVCSCAGEHHGGTGIRSDWYQTGRSTLVQYEKTQIDQLIIPTGVIPVRKKVPRPAPTSVAVVHHLPHPRPRPTPPQLRAVTPAPVPPPVLQVVRPVTPAAVRSFDVERPRAEVVSRPYVAPPAPARERRRSKGTLLALAAAVAVLAGIVGVIAETHHPAARPDSTQVAVQPPDTRAELPPPPPSEAATTKPFPPGCYPFQLNC